MPGSGILLDSRLIPRSTSRERGFATLNAHMVFRYERKQLEDDLVIWEAHGVPTHAEWSSCLDAVLEWLTEAERRGQRLRVLIDSSGMPTVRVQTRRVFGEWRAQHLALIANSVARAAYVADGPLLRSVLTAVFWIAPPVVPVEIVSSRREALVWLGALTPGATEELPAQLAP